MGACDIFPDCKNFEGRVGNLYTIYLPPDYGIVNEQIPNIALLIFTFFHLLIAL